MKKLQWILIVLFMAVLIIPVIALNAAPDQVSAIDNRKLADFPTLSEKKENLDLTAGIESYLSDRVGFRTQMINFYTELHDKLFNVMIHPSYIYGKDGYVFPNIIPEQHDPDYINDFADFIKKAQTYCDERGVPFLFWINPAKTTIYSEYLPDGVHLSNDRIKLLEQDLKERGVRYIESEPALMEAKKTTQVFNVKYDAGHWNDTGAFIGFSMMIDELRKDYPTIKPLTKSEFAIAPEHYSTLPVSYFKISDETDGYTPINPTAQQVDTYNNFIKINAFYPYFAQFVDPSNSDAPSIMAFRGSYCSQKEKFMVNQFSETTLIHNYVNILDLDYYYNLFKPDIVLFEVAEYAITDDYFPQAGLESAEFQPNSSDFANVPVENFAGLQSVDGSKIKEQAKDSESPLLDLTFSVDGKPISYAYAKIGDEWFDFKVNKADNGQKINITLKKDDILKADHMDILLVSQDKTVKNNISVDLSK